MGSHRVGHNLSNLVAAAAVFHCIYVPQLLYSFICLWTSRLLPCYSYCKQCCNEHWGMCVFLNFGFLWVYAYEYDSQVIRWFCSQFLKESPYRIPQWLNQSIFPPGIQEHSFFSTPSPAFIVCRLFDDGHSDWCKVVFNCSFDLHFSNNE